MIHCIRTESSNEDFKILVKELDAELAVRDGDEHAFYNQFNKIDHIRFVIVAYEGEEPVGCGAIKPLTADSMEVKRMYVPMQHRGRGIASVVLIELENWAKVLGYKKCMLETGVRQPEAIALYNKCGYQVIPNYGQYIGVANSLCFEKNIE